MSIFILGDFTHPLVENMSARTIQFEQDMKVVNEVMEYPPKNPFFLDSLIGLDRAKHQIMMARRRMGRSGLAHFYSIVTESDGIRPEVLNCHKFETRHCNLPEPIPRLKRRFYAKPRIYTRVSKRHMGQTWNFGLDPRFLSPTGRLLSDYRELVLPRWSSSVVFKHGARLLEESP